MGEVGDGVGEVGRGPPARCLHFILSCREPPGDFRRGVTSLWLGVGNRPRELKGSGRQERSHLQAVASVGQRWEEGGGSVCMGWEVESG